jgi:hypothetical protein
VRGALVWALTIAGCFGPEPREGLPCSQDRDCPPGQTCFGADPGVCAAAAPADGAPLDGEVGPDAAAPAVAFGTPEPVVLLCPGPVPCPAPREPTLTDDLTQIAFTVPAAGAAGNHDIMIASRGTAEADWGAAVSAGPMNSLQSEYAPALHGEGLLLWFSRDDQATAGAPYADILLSSRKSRTDPFPGAVPIAGVVNTAAGDERGVARTGDASTLLFARSLEGSLTDHDLYRASLAGGHWDTVERLAGASSEGASERHVAIAEAARLLFFVRDERIVEARWDGGDLEELLVHDELFPAGATATLGVWVSPDGREIWFGACEPADCALYRAAR